MHNIFNVVELSRKAHFNAHSTERLAYPSSALKIPQLPRIDAWPCFTNAKKHSCLKGGGGGGGLARFCACAIDDARLLFLSQSHTRSEVKRESECFVVSRLAVHPTIC